MKQNTEIVYDDSQKKYIPLKQAAVPIDDLVVLRGYGVQEHVRTYNLQPFYLDEHLDRLVYSAKILGIDPIPEKEYITEKITRGLKDFDEEVYLKILLTGGSGNTLYADQPSRLYILFLYFSQFLHPPEYYQGVSLKSFKFEREFAKAKTTGYLTAVVAGREIKSQGFDDILYVDVNDFIKEGSTYNIAGVFKNQVITPEKGVLTGITMSRALAHAQALGFKAKKDEIKLSDLYDADEVFITSTTREIVPVQSIDGQKIGSGEPSAVSQQLIDKFKQETENYGK